MGENNSVEISPSIRWTNKLEEYFASTGEKANGLAWVHKRAESLYSNRRTYIDLPVIIGSGVIAFLNAGSQTLFTDQRIASTALGVGSLFVGILNTVSTYFGWAKRAEGHRISAIHYAKLFRFITVELSLPREERMSPHDLLKYVKDQYDRLAEISPMVPDLIISQFQSKFKNQKDISKPEETNGIHKIEIYNPSDDEEDFNDRVLKSPMITKKTTLHDIMNPKELPTLKLREPPKVEQKKPVETVKKPAEPKEDETPRTEEVKPEEVKVEVPEVTPS
jgi:hypothetical protein